MASENISLELISDKQIYQVGENININLLISNSKKEDIFGQIKGKAIIGDIGFEIKCFEYNSLKNSSEYLSLSPIPASLSNSNRKSMTSLYICSGTQMQENSVIMDNKAISQSGEENFEIGPFTYTYEYNGTKYEVKSNVLNISVISSNQNQDENSQNNENQDENNQEQTNNQNQEGDGNNHDQNSNQNNGGNTQNNQDQTNNQNGQNLSSQNQQSLTNNQQNSQSVNQLKNEIQNKKNNLSNNENELENEKNNLLWLFLILIILLASILIYLKYFKKEEIKENVIVEKKEIPKYFKLLNQIKKTQDKKEKAKLLSQAIRTYIAQINNVEEDLTHSKAIEITKNELFIDLLKKTEKIEFAGKNISIDYDKIIKEIRGEFK